MTAFLDKGFSLLEVQINLPFREILTKKKGGASIFFILLENILK
jgi:hypothetical protein